jgi:hypothetical protein
MFQLGVLIGICYEFEISAGTLFLPEGAAVARACCVDSPQRERISMKMSLLATAVAVCAMGSDSFGQNVVPVGELSTCQTGVNGTFAVTTPGFDGTGGEWTAPQTWNFYTFYGVAGQVIDIEVDRATGELDPQMNLHFGDATGMPLADFVNLSSASTNPALTFLLWRDDEDVAAIPGPYADPLLTAYVLPSTGTYTLIVGSNSSNGGAASYDYVINLSALGATIDNVTQATIHPTLQDAINNAVAGDVIEIGAGTLCENVSVDRALTIRGAGMDATVIDGAFAGQVMNAYFAGDLFRLEGITLMNGGLSGSGGGLEVGPNIPTTEVVGVRILNNTANDLAGMAKVGGIDPASSLLVDGCEFIDNTATGGLGGGLAVVFESTNATIRNCLFKNNFAQSRVSAIYCQSAFGYNVDIMNCTFVEHGLSGLAAPQIVELAIAGASIDNFNLGNCVFQNDAALNIRVLGSLASGSVFNTVLGSTITLTGIADGGGNVATDPTFEDAANCDYRLAAGSSGIDMGDMNAYFAAGGGCDDLNGDPRFNNDPSTTDTGSVGSVLDAGCYEHQTALADTADCEGDANGDQVIDVNDISYVLFRLGNPCP